MLADVRVIKTKIMNTNTNNYIDFKSLFQDLYKEKESELEEEKYVADHFKQILEFYNEYDKVELLKEECEFNKASIVFVFYHETSPANESNPDSDGILTTIIFDRVLEEFVSFECES
jgi:hypothetical protein